MTFHPGIMALLLGSTLTTVMLLYAAYEGMRILDYWDLSSGSERQLHLERKTYLVSTCMQYAMGFQLLSLLLFIATVDTLSSLFIGAMCAAGSLAVNSYGYPTLVLKIGNCLLAGLWLIFNMVDNRAHDYPLIRTKYRMLLWLAPLLTMEALLQAAYLLSLRPNIITSCCSLTFSTESDTVVAAALTLPHAMTLGLFFACSGLTMLVGLYVALTARGSRLLALLSLASFLVAAYALVASISPYIYELPTHRCPFCILHGEYGHIGYVLYATLYVSAVTGVGTGILDRFRPIASLGPLIPPIQKKLALIATAATAVIALIVGYGMRVSNLNLGLF